MSVLEFTAALDGARTLAFVDEIARDLWRAYGAGRIGESDAEGIAARIEEARRRIRPQDTVRARAPAVPLAAVSMFPARKRRCVSPDRLKARARRRELSLIGSMPHALAQRFTEGERATLAIVAAEVKAKGACDLPLEAIAARAGVCVTLARRAIRLAAGDGLALIIERRRPGRPSLTNIVRIVSREWLAWIRRGGGGGCTKANPTEYKGFKQSNVSATARGNAEKRLDGKGGWREAAPARLATASG